MKLLFDEMYAPTIAEQLRGAGSRGRVVSENVRNFRRIEADALARGQPVARLIFSTDREFTWGDPGTLGRLVLALDAFLATPPDTATAVFLQPSTPRSWRRALLLVAGRIGRR